MSRKKRVGLSYFPLDVGIFKDPRIRRLNSRFGADGTALYLYILCAAYENGYYVEYSEDFIEDAAMDLSCTTEKIGLMLDYLLSKSLLDRKLFSTVKVLSSHGIQAQFQESMKGLKREITVRPDLWLLDESETLGFVFVHPCENKSRIYDGKSEIYDDKSGKLNTKENKRKENKLNETKSIYQESENSRFAAVLSGPDLLEVLRFMNDHDSAMSFYMHYVDEENGNWPDDWEKAALKWKQEHRSDYYGGL